MGRRSWLLIGTAVLAAAVFALMWVGYVRHWGWLVELDARGLAGPYRYGSAHPAWVTAWDVFCAVFGPVTFRFAGAVVIVIALVRKHFRIALFVLLTVELSGVVTQLTKQLVDRPRPATALVYTPSSSFPSGHALGVMVSVAALLVVVWPLVRHGLRGWLVVAGAVLVVAIGVGRVVLNVHHPSDVAAGWALGYAYFAMCLLAAPPYPERQGEPLRDETPVAPGSAR